MEPTTVVDSGGRGTTGRRCVAAVLLAIAVSLASAAQPAAAVSASEIGTAAFDVGILRPLNAAAVVLGAAFFVISVPFVAPFQGVGSAWDVFVYAPYEYTVERDIGDF